MARTLNILIVAGARPNFMKIAPLIRAVRAHNEQRTAAPAIKQHLVHTGQHYDVQMSDIFFRELGIPSPDISLGVGSGSHAEQTARIMMSFEPVCLRFAPDWVVVVGDVNSTLACSIVAAKLGIRIAHVEAGLRSFDRTMPEEVNRVVTDALADLLLTPSPDADENLLREGREPSRIRFVGNIMIDVLVDNLEQARRSDMTGRLGLRPREYAYVTLHRPANVDTRETLEAIVRELNRLADRLPVVFPVHPRTRKMIEHYRIPLNGKANMKLLEPIGYHDSLCLTENAKFVLTDSGGLQEESTYLRTPCLTLRPNTERPVTVTVGSNKLTRPDDLAADIEVLLKDGRPRGGIPPLWDGRTAERIVAVLTERPLLPAAAA